MKKFDELYGKIIVEMAEYSINNDKGLNDLNKLNISVGGDNDDFDGEESFSGGAFVLTSTLLNDVILIWKKSLNVYLANFPEEERNSAEYQNAYGALGLLKAMTATSGNVDKFASFLKPFIQQELKNQGSLSDEEFLYNVIGNYLNEKADLDNTLDDFNYQN